MEAYGTQPALSPAVYSPAQAMPTGYGGPIPLTPVVLDSPYSSVDYSDAGATNLGGGGGGGGGGLIIAPGLGMFPILKLIKDLLFLLPLPLKLPLLLTVVAVAVVAVVRIAVVVVPIILPGSKNFFDNLTNKKDRKKNLLANLTSALNNNAYDQTYDQTYDYQNQYNPMMMMPNNGYANLYPTNDQYPAASEYLSQDYSNYRQRRQAESALPLLTVGLLERLSSVVFAALSGEECTQRLICEAGSAGRNYTTIASVAKSIGMFVPEAMKSNYDIFITPQSCTRYRCGNTTARPDVAQHVAEEAAEDVDDVVEIMAEDQNEVLVE